MTKYFKRREPISYLDHLKNEELTIYIDTIEELEIYEDDTPREVEELGDYNFNKYSMEEE